jgi:CDP-4-dehydro-6-deoxyglucose reductase, E1
LGEPPLAEESIMPPAIPLIKTAFYNEHQTRYDLSRFIRSGCNLSMGEQCQMFEETFAKKQGRKYAVLVNSGGSANLALLQALVNLRRIHTGDRCGFSALTWSTNVMPIIQMGLTPVPVDVQPNTLNTTLAMIIQQAQPIRLMFVTNALGFCGDLDAISRWCRENGVILLEDNCESLGTVTQYGKTGNVGLASTFSFYVAHHISTIEGGMICTDDYELYNMLKIVRSNGWDRNLSEQEQLKIRAGITAFQAKYAFYNLAYNFKPTEITGWLGNNQMQYYDEIMAAREKNYRVIASAIKNNHEIQPLADASYQKLPAFAIPIICDSPESRPKYLSRFDKAGIETRPVIAGDITRQPFWQERYPARRMIGVRYIHDCGFYCGNCPDYTAEEIDTIVRCLE